MRRRGGKNSIDVTRLEEGICINKPRISKSYKPAMFMKNELGYDDDGRRFDVIKRVVQLTDRPVEWLEIVTLDQTKITTLETETYVLLRK